MDDEEEEEEDKDDDPFKGCEAIIQEEEDEDSQNESAQSYDSDMKNGDAMRRNSMKSKILGRRDSAANSDNNYAEMELFPGTKELK